MQREGSHLTIRYNAEQDPARPEFEAAFSNSDTRYDPDRQAAETAVLEAANKAITPLEAQIPPEVLRDGEIPFRKPTSPAEQAALTDIIVFEASVPEHERHVNQRLAASVLADEAIKIKNDLESRSMHEQDRYLVYAQGVRVLTAALSEYWNQFDEPARKEMADQLKSWQQLAENGEVYSTWAKPAHLFIHEPIARVIESTAKREQMKKDLVRTKVEEEIRQHRTLPDPSPAHQAELLFTYVTTLTGSGTEQLKRSCLELALIGAESVIAEFQDDKTIVEAAKKGNLHYLAGRIWRDYSHIFHDDPRTEIDLLNRAEQHLSIAHKILSGLHNHPLREAIKAEDKLIKDRIAVDQQFRDDPVRKQSRELIDEITGGGLAWKGRNEERERLLEYAREPDRLFDERERATKELHDLERVLYGIGQEIDASGNDDKRRKQFEGYKEGPQRRYNEVVGWLGHLEWIEQELPHLPAKLADEAWASVRVRELANTIEQRMAILLASTARERQRIFEQQRGLELGPIWYGSGGYDAASALTPLFDHMNKAALFRNECAQELAQARTSHNMGMAACANIITIQTRRTGQEITVSEPQLSPLDIELAEAVK